MKSELTTSFDALILTGPTGVGKSHLALQIADNLHGEIISMDSRLVYRGLDIGTDKPTPTERDHIPHHLIDIVDPGERFTVADFTSQCKRLVEEIKRRGKLPIIVGGTCMYLHALRESYRFCSADHVPALRKKLYSELKEKGSAAMHEKLRQIDPTAAQKIHIRDEYRILRALEIYHITGIPPSEHHRAKEGTSTPSYRYLTVALFLPRKKLYERINKRVDTMYNLGLINESDKIMKNFQEAQDWLKTVIGYAQAKAVIESEMTLGKAQEETRKETRHYARRQMIWFRRLRNIVWVYSDGKSGTDVIREICGAAHY